MEATPTPRPWHRCTASDGKCPCHLIYDNQGVSIATWYGDDRETIPEITVACPSVDEGMANAALIVRAVNSFDDLVAACERALDEMDGRPRGPGAIEVLRAALKKAGK